MHTWNPFPLGRKRHSRGGHAGMFLDGRLAASATTLNIDNGTDFQLTTTALAAADKLASVSLTGTGNFSADLSGIASLRSFDGAQSSGANTLTVASASGLVVKGGSGVDTVTMKGALAGNAVVQLGAGNDHCSVDQAALNGARVDAGAGLDTIVINDAALLPPTATPVYSGFETLDFSSGKGQYDLDLVGSVTTLHSHARPRNEVSFTNGRADFLRRRRRQGLELYRQPGHRLLPCGRLRWRVPG